MSTKRHIVFIDHTARMGGAEYSLEAIVTHLPKEQYEVTVVLPEEGPFADRLRQEGIKVLTKPMQGYRHWVRSNTDRLKFWLSRPLFYRSVRSWQAFLKELKPHVVHHNINRLVDPVVAARRAGIPSIMHYRDIPSRLEIKFATGKRAFYRVMHHADCWIANSDSSYNDISPYGPFKTTRIYNALDVNQFDARRTNHHEPKPEGKKVVAMVALLVPWKNHPDCIKVARQVIDQNPNVEFWLVGKGKDSYHNMLQQQINEAGLKGKVLLRGFHENIPGLFNTVDILLHTTFNEPFGRVFIEAMAANRPVVAYRSGGAHEIIVDQLTGYTVDDYSVDQAAQRVLALLADDALAQKMGQQGRKRVEKLFTLDHQIERLEEEYAKLIT